MDLVLRIMVNLLSLSLFLGSLLLPAEAAECSVEPGESQYDAHHFVCSNYYEALMASLGRDQNELYWLETLFFPPSGSVPHTLHLIATIEVEHIGMLNITQPDKCSRDAEPAFFRNGAFWVREWQISMSSSPIPTYAPMDVLFAFDSTMTWAVYAMATGLGSAISEGGNIRFFIDSLPCMPSLEVIKEVLEKIMSEMKGIARHHGKPRRVDEDDFMVVSSTYAIVPEGENIALTEPQEIGTRLLLSAFIMVQLLGISTVSFMLIAYYDSLRDSMKDGKHCAQSIYNTVVFLSLCFIMLRVGTSVIAGLSKSQFDFSTSGATVAFVLSSLFTLAAPAVETIIAVVVIILIRRSKGDDKNKSSFCEVVLELVALFIIFAFFQNIVAAVVPISVLLVMFPGEVISSVALISSSIACIAILTAHIFHLDSPSRAEKTSNKWLTGAEVVSQGIALVLFIGLLCIVFVFYLLLLSRGLDSAGLVGFVVSLIPSLILSYAAKLIGKRILNGTAADQN